MLILDPALMIALAALISSVAAFRLGGAPQALTALANGRKPPRLIEKSKKRLPAQALVRLSGGKVLGWLTRVERDGED
jgi:hypothetical protein